MRLKNMYNRLTPSTILLLTLASLKLENYKKIIKTFSRKQNEKNKSDVTDRDIIKACLDKRVGNSTLSEEELINLIKNQINSVFI